MKPEEAIKKLVALQDGNGDTYEAIRMAIEALEKTSGCKGCKQTQIHCFDCARNAPDFYKGEDDD